MDFDEPLNLKDSLSKENRFPRQTLLCFHDFTFLAPLGFSYPIYTNNTGLVADHPIFTHCVSTQSRTKAYLKAWMRQLDQSPNFGMSGLLIKLAETYNNQLQGEFPWNTNNKNKLLRVVNKEDQLV